MGKTTALMLAAALMTARTLDAQTMKVVVAPPPVALSGLAAFLEAPSASLTPPATLDFHAVSLRVAAPLAAVPAAPDEKWRALSSALKASAPAAAIAAPATAALPALSWERAARRVDEALAPYSAAELRAADGERLRALVADVVARLQGDALTSAGEAAVAEPDGVAVRLKADDGRTRRFKTFREDGRIVERSRVPRSLAGVYRELPGGAVRRLSADPLAAALDAAGVELWTLRHGETETNRRGLLAGGGTDAPLTRTPNEKGQTGEAQARAAARKLYAELGGDAWAAKVLAGESAPAAILSSPLRRARATAAAFEALLDERRAALGGGAGRALYEARVVPALAEMRYGALEGLPLDDARALALWKPWASAPTGDGRDLLDRFPGADARGRAGESRFDVILRQRRALRAILRDYPGRVVITFAHYETVNAQRAIFDRVDADPADGALVMTPVENAKPLRLTRDAATAARP